MVGFGIAVDVRLAILGGFNSFILNFAREANAPLLDGLPEHHFRRGARLWCRCFLSRRRKARLRDRKDKIAPVPIRIA